MNTLQSLHGHLSGFHFLIFWRKIGSVAQSLMLEGTKFQILGRRYDNVSVPYNAVFTLYERKLTSWRRLYGTLASLNNSHIIFGAMRCLTLYISRANFWMFRWWIVKELSFWRSSQKEELLSLWTKRSALSWSLFILLSSVRLWNIAQPCWGETQIKKAKVYYILITYFYSEKKVNII